MVIEALKAENTNYRAKYEKMKKTNNKMLLCLAEYQRKIWRHEKKLSDIEGGKSSIEIEEIFNTDDVQDDISKHFTAVDLKELSSIGKKSLTIDFS